MIRFEIYFNWFLINVGFCLLPILISILFITNLNVNIISSILVYSYTLTIAGLYLFDRIDKIKSSIKWVGIFFSFILFTFIVIYPSLLSSEQMAWVNNELKYILGCLLFITISFAFIMNLHSMNSLIDERQQSKKFEGAKETGKKVEDMIREIKNKSGNV